MKTSRAMSIDSLVPSNLRLVNGNIELQGDAETGSTGAIIRGQTHLAAFATKQGITVDTPVIICTRENYLKLLRAYIKQEATSALVGW